MWADFGTRLTVDTAFYQGDYHPDGNVSGVIVNVARGNQGSYSETTWGARQVANAKNAGKDWGGYFFNGNLDPYTCGVLFGRTLASLGFDPARNVVGVDCEDEGATGTHAWGPDQVAAFINGVASVIRGLTWGNVLVYMNYDVNHRFKWSAIDGYGARLWYARPGHTVDQAYWAVVTMKQDGLYNGVDADGHNLTYQQIIGAPVPKKQRRRSLVNLFAIDDWNGTVVAVGAGSIHPVTAAEYPPLKAVLYNSLDDANVAHISSSDLPSVLAGFGLGEYTVAQVQAAGAGNTLIATWADSRKAPTSPIDEGALASSISAVLVPAVTAAVPHEFTVTGKATA